MNVLWIKVYHLDSSGFMCEIKIIKSIDFVALDLIEAFLNISSFSLITFRTKEIRECRDETRETINIKH